MTRLTALFFLLTSAVFGQWAAATSGSTVLNATLDSKPSIQIGSGAPSGLNGTVGKDFYVDSAAATLYECSVTGTPATWKLVAPVSLLPSNNLSDLISAATARTNLGLGTAATQATGAFDAAGAATTAQAAAIASAVASGAQKASNLSDLASAATARTNLGLATVAATGAYTDLSGKPTIPTVTGGPCTNQAVTAISTSAVPTCITVTSAYVDTSIAKTGADINTSNQVTGGAHLTSGSTVVTQKFFGTTAPGSVAGNLPGDLFTDTTGHNEYICGAAAGTAAPACTAVTVGGWMLGPTGPTGPTGPAGAAGSLGSVIAVTVSRSLQASDCGNTLVANAAVTITFINGLVPCQLYVQGGTGALSTALSGGANFNSQTSVLPTYVAISAGQGTGQRWQLATDNVTWYSGVNGPVGPTGPAGAVGAPDSTVLSTQDLKVIPGLYALAASTVFGINTNCSLSINAIFTAGESGVACTSSAATLATAYTPAVSNVIHPIKDFASGGSPPTWKTAFRYARSNSFAQVNANSDSYIAISTSGSSIATSYGIRYNHTSAHWECYTNTSGTPVVANMGIAMDNAEHSFYIGNGGLPNQLVCQIDANAATTATGLTIPAGDVVLLMGVDTTVAGGANVGYMSADEFDMHMTGLTR